jgi:hypothetical protein
MRSLTTSPSPQTDTYEVGRLGQFVVDANLSDLGRVVDKFHWLAEPFADSLQSEIISAVEQLDAVRIPQLTGLLGAVSPTPTRPRGRGRF